MKSSTVHSHRNPLLPYGRRRTGVFYMRKTIIKLHYIQAMRTLFGPLLHAFADAGNRDGLLR